MEKRIIFIAAALASCLAAGAQTPDTLRIKNVSEVTVITSKDSQTISLKGSANDSTFRYESSVRITPESEVSIRESQFDLFDWDIFKNKRENLMRSKPVKDSDFAIVPDNPLSSDGQYQAKAVKTRHYRRVTSHEFCQFGIGLSFPYDGPSGMDLGGKVLSDIFVSIESVHFNFAWNHLRLSSGLNVGYRSFRLLDEGILACQDGLVLKAPVPSGLELKRSALRSNYVSVPATLGLSFGRNGYFEIYGGAELNCNFNGRIKNVYSQEQTTVPNKYTDVRLETLTWNYLAGINFNELGVYAKYSPCPFLQEGHGPAFNTYSVGLVFNL